ncbi:ABC transporter permease [Humibacter ginsenosidimutans]|uniref:ABC transporter permease n=1 Tax=Humibacter ginsenosidimutans TaxID=2599293 RepID=A0A5B8M9K0_9MICO|nr:ABC transporter permease [Humibacter ginsenosidimutans]QDZ16282.1 ABC transporter permease [Humibacter ginsenosidimutans]
MSAKTDVAAASTAGSPPPAGVVPPVPAEPHKNWMRRLTEVPEFGVVAACILVFVVVTAVKPSFANGDNLQVIGLDLADYGILAIGVTFTILTGGIDLSPGAIVAFASMVSADLNANAHWPVWLCLIVSLGIGLVIGYLHGWFVTRLNVPPFAITLVTLTAAAGGALALTQGQPISGVSPFYSTLVSNGVLGVPVPVIIFVVVALAAWFFLERMYAGRQIYAVGGNVEAARLAGIPVKRRILLTYVVSGGCAGLVAILVIGRIGVGDPSVGNGWELDAIAAAVIGGVSLYGGEGRIVGVVAGALLLMLINNALIVLNVSPFYQQVALGLVLGVAIVADRIRALRRGRPRPRRLPRSVTGAPREPAPSAQS